MPYDERVDRCGAGTVWCVSCWSGCVVGAEAMDVGLGLRRVTVVSSVMLERLCRGCRGDAHSNY